jgi:hypothetical protein
MNLKYVPLASCLDLRFAEVQRRPSFVQSVPSSNNIRADFAFIASALKMALSRQNEYRPYSASNFAERGGDS